MKKIYDAPINYFEDDNYDIPTDIWLDVYARLCCSIKDYTFDLKWAVTEVVSREITQTKDRQ